MSKIEWTERTWNPIIGGCSIVSEGCTNCYAMAMASRLEAMGLEKYRTLTRKTDKGKKVWTGKINIDMQDEALYEPLKRRKPTKYFVNSMSDLFHPAVPFEAVDKIMAVIALCPQHTFQVLTKRPERMKEYFIGLQSRQLVSYDLQINERFFIGLYGPNKETGVSELKYRAFDSFDNNKKIVFAGNLPLPHLWLGVSVENQEQADKRIPDLLCTPAAVRFLSCEPLLGEISFGKVPGFNRIGLDLSNWWVIVGGESGQNARPMQAEWARSIQHQCKAARVPFFFKQWGEYNEYGQKVGKKAAGRLLDGRLYDEMPVIKTPYTNE